jgi:thiamine-phosphate pyrophosphorylase
MHLQKEKMRLYAVTDRAWLKNGESLAEVVEKAIKGGATFIQLREKTMTHSDLKTLALEVKAVCKRYEVPFVINDDVELALEVDADGVHIGQTDMEIRKAREILGKDKIIGVTANTIETALAAERHGADYLGVGAAFPTSTKSDAKPVSREELYGITGAVTIPVVAIGGIKKENAASLAGLNIDGIAVVSAIFAQADVEAAAKALRLIVDEVIV